MASKRIAILLKTDAFSELSVSTAFSTADVLGRREEKTEEVLESSRKINMLRRPAVTLALSPRNGSSDRPRAAQNARGQEKKCGEQRKNTADGDS
jgi:hypothetical protein